MVEPETEWNLPDPSVLRWMLERKFSLRLLAEFTEMRLGIEAAAAALAARNADETGLEGIRKALNRMEGRRRRRKDDPLSADIAFHVAILSATKNPFYRDLHELVNTALRISIRFTNRIKGRTASIPRTRTWPTRSWPATPRRREGHADHHRRRAGADPRGLARHRVGGRPPATPEIAPRMRRCARARFRDNLTALITLEPAEAAGESVMFKAASRPWPPASCCRR